MFRIIFRAVLTLVIVLGLVRAHRCHQNDNDPGQPLFLTPLIKQGKVQEAREAASVPGRFFTNLPSYSGYLTVNEQYNSNTFFWYFPAKVNPQSAPIIVWLEGGPGASSLFGLFIEIGPIELMDDGTVRRRRYSWNNLYNVIYIDNPVGSGYSFTDNDAGYAKNDDDYSRDLYEAVRQLYTLFPEFKNLDFYIAGSSYAGKFVPAFAHKIHKTQEELTKGGRKPDFFIKLAGIAIGNGFTDPLTQIDYGDNLYGLGLIDESGLSRFKEMESGIHDCIRKNDAACVNAISQKTTTNAMGGTEGTLFGNLTGFTNLFKFTEDEFDLKSYLAMRNFVQKPNIRKAIHVGNNTFRHLDETTAIVEEKLKDSVIKSLAPLMVELLNHYRVCIFNGHMDLLITYWPTVRYLQKLQFNGALTYKQAERRVWRVDGAVAGYVKEGGNLVEVMVRNAGHLATADQPKWCLDMIKKFINREQF